MSWSIKMTTSASSPLNRRAVEKTMPSSPTTLTTGTPARDEIPARLLFRCVCGDRMARWRGLRRSLLVSASTVSASRLRRSVGLRYWISMCGSPSGTNGGLEVSLPDSWSHNSRSRRVERQFSLRTRGVSPFGRAPHARRCPARGRRRPIVASRLQVALAWPTTRPRSPVPRLRSTRRKQCRRY
jgi:hypothetical protein